MVGTSGVARINSWIRCSSSRGGEDGYSSGKSCGKVLRSSSSSNLIAVLERTLGDFGRMECPWMVISPVDQLILGLFLVSQVSPRMTSSCPVSVISIPIADECLPHFSRAMVKCVISPDRLDVPSAFRTFMGRRRGIRGIAFFSTNRGWT